MYSCNPCSSQRREKANSRKEECQRTHGNGKSEPWTGRDGALRRRRRVQRRNEAAIVFTKSIPRLNGAGTAQRACPYLAVLGRSLIGNRLGAAKNCSARGESVITYGQEQFRSELGLNGSVVLFNPVEL